MSETKDWLSSRTSYAIAWLVPTVIIFAGIPLAMPFKGFAYALGMTWIGIACVINAKRCGRFHCHISGPLGIALGAMALIKTLGVIDVAWIYIMGSFGIGIFLSYIPEFFGKKYLREKPSC